MSGVASFIQTVAGFLPQWHFLHNIADDVNTLSQYIQKANTILPIETAVTLLSLAIGLELLLIAFYWISRTINLIRGAG